MITEQTYRAQFDISSSVPTDFPFNFFFAAYEDFHAILTLTTGETVTLARGADFRLTPPAEGGTLTRLRSWDRLAATLTIYRETPLTQEVDFRNGDLSDAETHELAHDKIVAILQEREDEIQYARAIKHPETDPDGLEYMVPAVAARANRFLGYDASGNVELKDSPVLSGADLGTGWTGPLSQPLGSGWDGALIAALGENIAELLAENLNPEWLTALQNPVAGAYDFLGAITEYPYRNLPDENHAWADGGSLSRTTYATYFAMACPIVGNFTVTIASPGVVTLAGHGYTANDTGSSIFLQTTGALPTGLAADTMYYIIYVNANTLRLATTRANARAGTAINTTGSQSGVHTLRDCPHGIASASTFNKPDRREASPYGAGERASGVTAHDKLVPGEFADDRFQGFAAKPAAGAVLTTGPGTSINGSGSWGQVSSLSPQTDGVNGVPRTGLTTRGKIVGTKYMVRIQ